MFPGTEAWSQPRHLHLLCVPELALFWFCAWLVLLQNHLPLKRNSRAERVQGWKRSPRLLHPKSASLWDGTHGMTGQAPLVTAGAGSTRRWQSPGEPRRRQRAGSIFARSGSGVLGTRQRWWVKAPQAFVFCFRLAVWWPHAWFFCSLPALVSLRHDPLCRRTVGIAGKQEPSRRRRATRLPGPLGSWWRVVPLAFVGNPPAFSLLSFRDVTSLGCPKCTSWPLGTQGSRNRGCKHRWDGKGQIRGK